MADERPLLKPDPEWPLLPATHELPDDDPYEPPDQPEETL